MATISDIVTRVRLEIGDEQSYFEETQIANGEDHRIFVPHYPLDATSVVVKDNGTVVDPTTYTVEEWSGVTVFNTAPAAAHIIRVSGTKWRIFTQTDLTTICQDAVNMHLNNRTDAFGRGLTLAIMDNLEIYPVALLAASMALNAMANDASLDIDISTPDGVSIPRSQRFHQLLMMAEQRLATYNDLCLKLNIGLNMIFIGNLRRKAKRTNRLVPIYIDQEIDDRSMPQREWLPIPTNGTTPTPDDAGVMDFIIPQRTEFNETLTFSVDISSYSAQAQVRLYPGSPAALAQFTITPIDAYNMAISLPATVTENLPLNSFWDLYVYPTSAPGSPDRWMSGHIFSPRGVTEPAGVLPSLPEGVQPPLLKGTAQGGFTALSTYNGVGQGA